MTYAFLILISSTLAFVTSARDCSRGQYRDPGMPCRNCPDGSQPVQFLKAFARTHPECSWASAVGGSISTPTQNSRTDASTTLVMMSASSRTVVEVTRSKVVTARATPTVGPELQPTTSHTEEPSGSSSHLWLIPVLSCSALLVSLAALVAAYWYFCGTQSGKVRLRQLRESLRKSIMRSPCPRKGESNSEKHDDADQPLQPLSSSSNAAHGHTRIGSQALFVDISTAGPSQSYSPNLLANGTTVVNKPESLNRSEEV